MIIPRYQYHAYLDSIVKPIVKDGLFNSIPPHRRDVVEISKMAKDKYQEMQQPTTKKKYVNSYLYFENRDCCFFPCHSDCNDGHNCMFCRCPMYYNDKCPGISNKDAIILENGVKDCTKCDWNHRYSNAEELSRYFKR